MIVQDDAKVINRLLAREAERQPGVKLLNLYEKQAVELISVRTQLRIAAALEGLLDIKKSRWGG